MFKARFFILLTVSIFHQAFCFEVVPPEANVLCYSSTDTGSNPCSGDSMGTMMARDCCSGNGNTLTFNNKCLGCFFAGFNVTSLKFTAKDAGRTFQVPFVVKKAPSSSIVSIRTNSEDFSEMSLTKRNEYVTNYPVDITDTVRTPVVPLTYDLTIPVSGNSKALEPALQFSLKSRSEQGFGDVAVVLYPDTVSVTVEDLDVIVFNFERVDGTTFTEGDEGGVIVERNSVRPSRPVYVFVTARKVTGSVDLGPNKFAADPEDFYPSETETYIFEENGDSRIQKLFSAQEDNIVEPGLEVFEVFLTTNETEVVISSPNVSKLFIADDDDFRIGFENNEIEKIEGESISLTIVQTNDVVGQLRTGDIVLDPPTINNIAVTATVDQDYNFTDVFVPSMKINETTGKLLPASFYIGSTFVDNVFEGAERFAIRLSSTPTEILQVGDDPNAYITIRDATSGMVKLKEKEYNVSESQLLLEVCAEIVDNQDLDLPDGNSNPLNIFFEITPGTAHATEDYIKIFNMFSFSGDERESCNSILIVQNQIKEDLYESFTINLLNYTGGDFTSLTVDSSPSTVYIEDDDRAEIFFVSDFVQFSENDGNQTISLLLQGGALSSPVVAIVIDTNSGREVGKVEFRVTSSTTQSASFTFNNPDNEIALEPNRTIKLGIADLDEIGIGSPSEMTVLIYDDDVVSVTFTSPSYHYSEDHGRVDNIGLSISHQIAQDLEIYYSGESSTQTGVEVSGVPVMSYVVFPANSVAGVVELIDEFTIFDDETALELDEQYQIFLVNASIDENVVLGSPANITVMDDDFVEVDFESGSYQFYEGELMSHDIYLRLSTSIAQPLSVFVSGGPGTDQETSVHVSGSFFNDTVWFPVGHHPASLPSFSINDDITALETLEQYQLSIDESYPSDNVILGNSSIIIIIDDDNLTVSFSQAQYTFQENDGETFNRIAVNLSNPIAQHISVNVNGDNSGQLNTVVPSGFTVNTLVAFNAFSRLSESVQSFIITDDSVALETVEMFSISLGSSHVLADKINFAGSAEIMINDNDDVTVSFTNSTYRFMEDESGMIRLMLSTSIAQDVMVSVSGAPGIIPEVINSGPTISETVTFTAGGPLMDGFSIEIRDDDYALEAIESYMINMDVVSPISSHLLIGAPTTIEITSNDTLQVLFAASSNTFDEGSGINRIGVEIKSPIAQDITIDVFGESIPTMGIAVSGSVVNTSVTFNAQSLTSAFFNIFINSDDIALENDEVYEIKFDSSFPSDGVELGLPTEVIIRDINTVTVLFDQSMYSFSEDADQSSGISVNLSNPIAQNLFVSILADPGQQPITVERSGSFVNTSVTFSPSSDLSIMVPSFTIINDMIGLETIETYDIQLTSTVPSSNVNLGASSTISIVDDDVPVIRFVSDSYNFTEGDLSGLIELSIDRIIYQDISVDIFGESAQQFAVFNNGPAVQATLTFQARGSSSVSYSLPIGVDFISRENDEIYQISINGSNREAILMPHDSSTTIKIFDNNDASVYFVNNEYEFLENAGFTEDVMVRLAEVIARELTVTIIGDTSPLTNGVVDSGTTVNQTITFKAFNMSQANLMQSVGVMIVNDDVSGEPDQFYDLHLVQVPSDVSVITQTTTIKISDDDESGLRFLPFSGTLFESVGRYALTVILTGETSSNVSVDVADENGVIIGTATFLPMPGISSQSVTVNISISDDNIALEDDETLMFSLINPRGATLASPSNIFVVVTDDDVVTVEFLSSTYNYSEDHGLVDNIQVQLSNEIANNFSVSISGGPMSLPSSVVMSGILYSRLVFFPSNLPESTPVSIDSFTLQNDNVGLESLEQYQLFIGSVPVSNVRSGSPTTISITDDDVVTVGFLENGEIFSEGSGEQSISISVNREVAVPFSVNIVGVTTPLLPGIEDSGSNVSELVTFPAKSSTREVSVVVNITDDDVSGEPLQTYSLRITEEPSSVVVDTSRSSFDISITDNDQAGIRFLPFEDPLFESSGHYNLTVVLDGETSSPVTVNVTNAEGIVVGTVTFQPMPQVLSQEAIVTILFEDDDIALEQSEVLQFTLVPVGNDVILNGPPTIDVVVTDDDVLMVMFTNTTYKFMEGETRSIGVVISNEIARDLTISVLGAPGMQNYVINSGPTINEMFTFTPSSSRFRSFFVTALDDFSALENVESYSIRLDNINSVSNVDIGSNSTIEILDTDVVRVDFSSQMIEFGENDGTRSIEVTINQSIARPLSVDIFGESKPTMFVETSAQVINTTVVFGGIGGNRSEHFQVFIGNDETGLEDDEVFEIQLTESFPSDSVILGDNTRITVKDDDDVIIAFEQQQYSFNESDVSSFISIVLNRVIARNATVEVIGDSTDISTVSKSGVYINETVSFFAHDTDLNVRFPLNLRDDFNALEDVEIYTLRIVNPFPSTIATGSNSNVMILDDDVVTVSFANQRYSFNENEVGTFIGIFIDRTILKPLEVAVFGMSVPMAGITVSGLTVNNTVFFEAQSMLFKTLNIGIQDDLVALEDPERFSVDFTSSTPARNVRFGPETMITIQDNDGVRVYFEENMYSFNESDGYVTVRLLLNEAISQPVSVNVLGGISDDPMVSSSIPFINETIMFVPNNPLFYDLMFMLVDDEDALEDPEMLTLYLSDPNIDNINIASTANIEILDDDVVEVNFVNVGNSVSENTQSKLIGVEINRKILKNLTINVLGVSNNDDGVSISAQALNTDILFDAEGSRLKSFTIVIDDDNVALENNEVFNVRFGMSSVPDKVQLGPNRLFDIVDDDNVTVLFMMDIYSAMEDDGTIEVIVEIDNRIRNEFAVDVTGNPYPQPATVIVSGSRVNRSGTDNLVFNDSVTQWRIIIDINDDQVSLEDVEEYPLQFSSVSNSRVILGPDTIIRITDNDVFSYGTLDGPIFSFPENEGDQILMINFSPSIRNLTFYTNSVLNSSEGIDFSLIDIDCGQDDSDLIHLQPSLESFTVNCSISIQDDAVAHENDESYTLSINLVNFNSSTFLVSPGRTVISLSVLDDDVAEVVTDVPRKNVTEGDDTFVCVYVTGMTLKGLSVTLKAIAKSAEEGADFIGGRMKTVIIPAGSNQLYCTNYSTLLDSDFEDNEEFDVVIDDVSLIDNPLQSNFLPPRIGSQSSTTILISDVPPDSRLCSINSMTQMISTFGDSKVYSYNQTCEHSLLLQMTALGEFGVFIESLDRTLATSRVGLRLGSTESVVISVYNMTVIRQKSGLSAIEITPSFSKLTVSVPLLGFRMEISNGVVLIQVDASSQLTTHNGLCGNINGNLMLRNGSIIDTSNTASVARFISQNLVPPSETFIRMVARQECGLTGEDLETGDPMFVVPLYTPSENNPHSYSLCYEIHGEKDETYNFVSDECTEVHAHYYKTTDPDPEVVRPFHAVDRITVTAHNNLQQCVSVTVSLGANSCSTSLGGSMLTEDYMSYGVSVRQSANRTRIAVPNCANNRLIMNIMCRDMGTTAPYLEFRIVRGLNLRESSHGLIGQFWNVESTVSKYEQPLRDGMVLENAYLVQLKPKGKPMRSFIGFLHSRTWNFNNFPCIYAGNAQGGPIYEAADGEPNDSLIEGSILDYSMSNFKYNQFNEC